MLDIFQAETKEDIASVRELFWEYLVWANSMNESEFNVSFDINLLLERDMEELNKFFLPRGRLLVAVLSEQHAGLICLKEITEDTGEIKRTYVRPEFRGRGIGRALLNSVLEEARTIGYKKIRLDSAGYMKEAHSLYRSVGFKDIEPYGGSEVPEEFKQHWVFMETQLV